MSQESNGQKPSAAPPCPWGAPLSSAQWGSPLPGANSSPQPLMSGGGLGNSSQNTPAHSNNSHPYQRPSPHRSYPDRMQNPLNSNSPRGQFHNNRGQYSSPRHFQPRPRYQSSPLAGHTPGSPGSMRQSFTPQRNYQTPSPVGFSPSHQRFGSRGGSGNRRNFNNTPGSFNASQYVNPGMLGDPWKDMPATPMLKSY
ncbi:eukaryotic peptide chain release factor GTP-binding subunit [Aplysia californica]|uniref:Eukaryotic peptide chain release factor GTP-binding subunit n=1 Tax=Aplysia californica TaxID=6500 RepID=A0ABM0JV59_APLCA|nr:eukaryotic peptide chain release factor GTP-binding subunit [Aplysia californica]